MTQNHAAVADFGNWQSFSILIVDDEAGVRSFLERALKARLARVTSAASAEDATELMARRHFDLIILDISLPGKSGIEWLFELRAAAYAGDVIMITAFADMDTAISALRGGAADFILKPFRVDQMLNSIRRSFERARLARENFVLRRALDRPCPESAVDGLIGRSPPISELRALVQRVAPMPTTVLLLGESGTGKEVTARALHRLSPRAARSFVPVNCAAIAPELIESELFGHVRGAFTGASEARHGLFYYAHGGTLFLDEIGELPLAMQTKLLRVLEEKSIRPVGSVREQQVDVRIVAASNRDLAAEAAAGRFRQDLYFRLAVVDIVIPPLRARSADVAELAAHFMQLFARDLGVEPLRLTPAILARLAAYPWPGNVRELRNYVERSLILGGFADPGGEAAAPEAANQQTLAAVERQHIERVLAACGGNKSHAARTLGVSRKTLERKSAEWAREGQEAAPSRQDEA